MDLTRHPEEPTPQGIKIAFFLNLAFTLLEIGGGLLTNSVAILSDAVHDLGDSLTLGMAWYLERYAQRDRDERFSYGYRRFSLLGALISTTVLLTGGIFVLSEAVPRLLEPEATRPEGMLVFALFGVVVNGFAVFRLHGSHSHNARMIAWHLLEDVMGWIAVFVVSIVLLFTDLYILDPILSILITLVIGYNVVRNLKETLSLFLQGVPESVDIAGVEARVREVENVISVHHIHAWSLDGEHHVLTMHVVVEGSASKEQALCVKEDIRDMLEDLDFSHVTVDIEYGEADCVMASTPSLANSTLAE